jgi:hypothetical protein
MPIASSGRWTASTVERLKLDQSMGPVMTGPIFLSVYKQRLNGGAILNESDHAARSDDAGGLR